MIQLWNGYRWDLVTFTEKTLALGTITSGQGYDVFGYLSSGTLAVELLAWTNTTTRATAVTRDDGRLIKSGDKTRLLLGSFETISTTTTTDTETRRYLSNVYNQVHRPMTQCPGYSDGNSVTSYTLNSINNFVELNGGTNARISWFATLPNQAMWAVMTLLGTVGSAVGNNIIAGVGLDTVDTAKTSVFGFNANSRLYAACSLSEINLAVGHHYAAMIGATDTADNTTIHADIARYGGTSDPRATVIKGWVMA